MRRCAWGSGLVLVMLAVCAIAAPAPMATAHTNLPADAKHYETRLSGIDPAVPGVAAQVDPRGDWIEVSNVTRRPLVILGYAREPFLRIDATGVQENSLSVSAQLNQGLVGDLDVAGLRQPPAWLPVSKGHSARWHDLRIHWGSTQRPDGVAAHPDHGQLIARWTIHMHLGSTPVAVNGTLRWLPITPRSTLAMTGAVLVVIVIPMVALAVMLWYLRRRRIRSAARYYSVERAGAAST